MPHLPFSYYGSGAEPCRELRRFESPWKYPFFPLPARNGGNLPWWHPIHYYNQCEYWNLTWALICLLFGGSSDYAQPIPDQFTEVTCPVIGRAQPELTPSKRQKMDLVELHAFIKSLWVPELSLLQIHTKISVSTEASSGATRYTTQVNVSTRTSLGGTPYIPQVNVIEYHLLWLKYVARVLPNFTCKHLTYIAQ